MCDIKYIVYMYILPLCGLPFHFLDIPLKHKFLILMESNIYFSPFLYHL